MNLFIGFKNAMIILFISMIGVYILCISIYTLYKNITMKIKTSYLKSIGFKRILYRQAMFGNYDKYKWERNDKFITENKLEKMSLHDLKITYK